MLFAEFGSPDGDSCLQKSSPQSTGGVLWLIPYHKITSKPVIAESFGICAMVFNSCKQSMSGDGHQADVRGAQVTKAGHGGKASAQPSQDL